MKFLLEILGMTNQCNLRCSYCDWVKDTYLDLNDINIDNVKKYFNNIRETIDKKAPEIVLVEYSGGEPFVYPEILNILLDTFCDKWIRIITNGSLIQEEQISKIKQHGKTFIALSLDGNTMEANYPRVGNNKQLFSVIMHNLDRLIDNEIPVMILCTINKFNIDKFPEYISYLEKKYKKQIQEGMLVLPAHYVTNYSKDNGMPDKRQEQQFIEYLKNSDSLIINNIREYYECLIYYMENKDRKYHCNIPNWLLSMHFRKNEIIENGKFLSFGCGMRGIKELGKFDCNNAENIERYINMVSDRNLADDIVSVKVDNSNMKSVEEYGVVRDSCEEMCFVDWVSFELILSGVVSLKAAKEWFVFFRDSKVQAFVEKSVKLNRNFLLD